MPDLVYRTAEMRNKPLKTAEFPSNPRSGMAIAARSATALSPPGQRQQGVMDP